jgi:hypothetical protein
MGLFVTLMKNFFVQKIYNTIRYEISRQVAVIFLVLILSVPFVVAYSRLGSAPSNNKKKASPNDNKNNNNKSKKNKVTLRLEREII